MRQEAAQARGAGPRNSAVLVKRGLKLRDRSTMEFLGTQTLGGGVQLVIIFNSIRC